MRKKKQKTPTAQVVENLNRATKHFSNAPLPDASKVVADGKLVAKAADEFFIKLGGMFLALSGMIDDLTVWAADHREELTPAIHTILLAGNEASSCAKSHMRLVDAIDGTSAPLPGLPVFVEVKAQPIN